MQGPEVHARAPALRDRARALRETNERTDKFISTRRDTRLVTGHDWRRLHTFGHEHLPKVGSYQTRRDDQRDELCGSVLPVL